MTVTDKQTIRKILNINHKNAHINTIRIKENKQLNIQQKQNYPGSVASYDSQPGNEVGLFYNGPGHHMGLKLSMSKLIITLTETKCDNENNRLLKREITSEGHLRDSFEIRCTP